MRQFRIKCPDCQVPSKISATDSPTRTLKMIFAVCQACGASYKWTLEVYKQLHPPIPFNDRLSKNEVIAASYVQYGLQLLDQPQIPKLTGEPQ